MTQKHLINKILDLIDEIKQVDVMIVKHHENPSTFMVDQYKHKKTKLINEFISLIKKTI